MKFYHQIDPDGWITSVVKTVIRPNYEPQIVRDIPLPPGLKKFHLGTKEVVFYKATFDENDEFVETIEDTSKDRILIADEDVLTFD